MAQLLDWDYTRFAIGPLTLPSSPWAFLTTNLLHVSPMHLLFNIAWWVNLGARIELLFGYRVLIGLFLATGVIPAFICWLVGAYGIGLSGVVYGLFGFLWVMTRRHPTRVPLLDPGMTAMMVGWFFVAILITWLQLMNIGNLAHGVGAVTGALLGLVIPAPLARWRHAPARSPRTEPQVLEPDHADPQQPQG